MIKLDCRNDLAEEEAVTGFTFSLEQIKSAPPEVRRWFEREIAVNLAQIGGPARDAAPMHGAALAACTPDEAAQLFELIKGDFLLSQVFFELGRDSPDAHGAAPLHTVALGDLLRHTRIGGVDRLSDYFGAINQAFQAIRSDPEATLFGFDQQGHVFIHEATCRSIRHLWEQLFAGPISTAGLGGPADGRLPSGFAPPHLGPSEAVAPHRSGGVGIPG
jgi:hypothetical protein